MITININTREISVDVSEEEFARRRKEWKPRDTQGHGKYLTRYSNLVGSVWEGAQLAVNFDRIDKPVKTSDIADS